MLVQERMTTDQIGILVVEDFTSMSDAVINYVGSYKDANGHNPYAIAALATTEAEARQLIVEADYAVVVLDLSLDRPATYPHGFDLAVLIHEVRPDARIVVWSQYATVEGDLLRRAAQPLDDRFLVDAIVSKDQPLSELMTAIDVVCTRPEVYLWVDPKLRPPRGYSAILDFTPAEDQWMRDFAQHPGAKPRDALTRLAISRSTYYGRRDDVLRKVVREMRARNDKHLAMICDNPSTMSDEDLVRLMSDEVILRWAEVRHLDWPITEGERRLRSASGPANPPFRGVPG